MGSARPGVLALAFIIFAARDMPGSPVTEAISVPLLFGAIGAFASAARIGRDGGTAAALPAHAANRRPRPTALGATSHTHCPTGKEAPLLPLRRGVTDRVRRPRWGSRSPAVSSACRHCAAFACFTWRGSACLGSRGERPRMLNSSSSSVSKAATVSPSGCRRFLGIPPKSYLFFWSRWHG